MRFRAVRRAISRMGKDLTRIVLSYRWLEKARRRGIHTSRTEADAVESLRLLGKSRDVVPAGAVFIELGKLDTPFEMAATAVWTDGPLPLRRHKRRLHSHDILPAGSVERINLSIRRRKQIYHCHRGSVRPAS